MEKAPCINSIKIMWKFNFLYSNTCTTFINELVLNLHNRVYSNNYISSGIKNYPDYFPQDMEFWNEILLVGWDCIRIANWKMTIYVTRCYGGFQYLPTQSGTVLDYVNTGSNFEKFLEYTFIGNWKWPTKCNGNVC